MQWRGQGWWHPGQVSVVTLGAGFCGVTLYHVTLFAAVTDLGKNYVLMRMATKNKRSSPEISRVFGRILVSLHKMVSHQNRDALGRPPSGPTPSSDSLQTSYKNSL